MNRISLAGITLIAVVASATPAAASTPPTVPATAPAAAPADTTTGAVVSPTPARTVAELLALGRPLVLAHTGGEDAYPGSTMYGFGESVKAGVDMLDLNVMLSKDDRLVIQHDGTVDRTTNGTGTVVEMTYDELAALDNAHWFTAHCGACKDAPEADYVWRGVRTGAKPPPAGYTADDFAIPTLDELIAKYPGVPLNVEIEAEGDGARTAKVLADLLVATKMTDRVVVSSFDDAVLDAFRAVAPAVEVSPGLGLTTTWVLGRVPLPAGMRILQLPPQFGGTEILTAQQIADAHAAGYLIWVWPNDRALENLAAYRTFVAMGLDGLNINQPADGVAAIAGG